MTANKANAQPATTSTHTVAQFVGHSGTKRVITKADQDRLVGVPGVATADLVWEPGNTKLDVTGAHEDVLAYLKGDKSFKLTSVDVPAQSA